MLVSVIAETTVYMNWSLYGIQLNRRCGQRRSSSERKKARSLVASWSVVAVLLVSLLVASNYHGKAAAVSVSSSVVAEA